MLSVVEHLKSLRRPSLRPHPAARPPGPRGMEIARLYLTFGSDQIGNLRALTNEYGQQFYFRMAGFENYVFTDPESIEEILVKKSAAFHKDTLTHELEPVLGKGLLTAEDELWRSQRRLIAPALQRRHIESYADTMVDFAQQMLRGWRDGEVRPFHHDMMEVALRIVVKTLFNQELEGDLREVGELLDIVLDHFHEHANTPWRLVPEPLPTPMRKKNRQAIARLDQMMYELIARRRRQAEADAASGAPEGNDLLYRLIVATDEDGNQMNDRQLRDEALTFFLAGHETTALALTYSWYLLTGHPEVARKVRDEVDAVLGQRSATADDVRRLPYTEAVVKETLRLYPPAWIVGREAREPVEIGGWHIPQGAQVLTPQCIVHRDPRWFERPNDFWPERWLDGLEKRLPRYAYFPFGGGPRVCIGNYFALMEATLLVATMAQHVRLQNVSPEPLRTQPVVTQRPASEVLMKVHRR